MVNHLLEALAHADVVACHYQSDAYTAEMGRPVTQQACAPMVAGRVDHKYPLQLHDLFS
jgi:hypothetical protein